MANELKRQKLSTRFTAMCVIPAAALLAFMCVISVMITSSNLIGSIKFGIKGQNVSRTDGITKSIYAITQSEMFTGMESGLKNYLNRGNTESIKDLLISVKSKSAMFSSIAFYDLDNGIYYDPYGEYAWADNPYWYDEEKIAAGNPYFFSEDIMRKKNGNLLTYICPVSSHDDGVNDYCIVSVVDNDTLINGFELVMSVRDTVWLIASADDRVIYYFDEFDRNLADCYEALMTDYDPERKTVNYNGESYVVYKNKVNDLGGISLVYIVPVSSVIRDSTVSIILVIILSIISFAIITFFIRFMTRNIVNEITQIRGSLSGLREKKYIRLENSAGNDEMSDLIDDFNEVVDILTYQAMYDDNTGFLNSRAFAEKTAEIIENDGGRRRFAVIRMDIDNFSFINDIFDWEVGNSILVKIADILRSTFAGDSVHGYLGNDIFVILAGYTDTAQVHSLIMKAADSIKNCDKRIALVPHFGIYDNVKSNSDINVVCDCAGVALKTIKGNLLQVYAEYNEKFREKHRLQMFVESSKNSALFNREFFIQLQPKCNITTGEVVGAEALVRWRIRQTGEFLSPSKFIPIFEKNGFILELDRYVWEETCKVIKSWHDRGYRDMPVSVNVSRMHINNPEFVDHLQNLVTKYGIRPELLEIEITESALLESGEEELAEIMKELKSRGFKLLMDDFAQGSSSLLSLRNLPFDVIKMDKALVDDIQKPENKKYAAVTVNFLLELDKEIVVEGVETYDQKVVLRDIGCRIIQGYIFSKPVDIQEFEKLAFGL